MSVCVLTSPGRPRLRLKVAELLALYVQSPQWAAHCSQMLPSEVRMPDFARLRRSAHHPRARQNVHSAAELKSDRLHRQFLFQLSENLAQCVDDILVAEALGRQQQEQQQQQQQSSQQPPLEAEVIHARHYLAEALASVASSSAQLGLSVCTERAVGSSIMSLSSPLSLSGAARNPVVDTCSRLLTSPDMLLRAAGTKTLAVCASVGLPPPLLSPIMSDAAARRSSWPWTQRRSKWWRPACPNSPSSAWQWWPTGGRSRHYASPRCAPWRTSCNCGNRAQPRRTRTILTVRCSPRRCRCVVREMSAHGSCTIRTHVPVLFAGRTRSLRQAVEAFGLLPAVADIIHQGMFDHQLTETRRARLGSDTLPIVVLTPEHRALLAALTSRLFLLDPQTMFVAFVKCELWASFVGITTPAWWRSALLWSMTCRRRPAHVFHSGTGDIARRNAAVPAPLLVFHAHRGSPPCVPTVTKLLAGQDLATLWSLLECVTHPHITGSRDCQMYLVKTGQLAPSLVSSSLLVAQTVSAASLRLLFQLSPLWFTLRWLTSAMGARNDRRGALQGGYGRSVAQLLLSAFPLLDSLSAVLSMPDLHKLVTVPMMPVSLALHTVASPLPADTRGPAAVTLDSLTGVDPAFNSLLTAPMYAALFQAAAALLVACWTGARKPVMDRSGGPADVAVGAHPHEWMLYANHTIGVWVAAFQRAAAAHVAAPTMTRDLSLVDVYLQQHSPPPPSTRSTTVETPESHMRRLARTLCEEFCTALRRGNVVAPEDRSLRDPLPLGDAEFMASTHTLCTLLECSHVAKAVALESRLYEVLIQRLDENYPLINAHFRGVAPAAANTVSEKDVRPLLYETTLCLKLLQSFLKESASIKARAIDEGRLAPLLCDLWRLSSAVPQLTEDVLCLAVNLAAGEPTGQRALTSLSLAPQSASAKASTAPRTTGSSLLELVVASLSSSTSHLSATQQHLALHFLGVMVPVVEARSGMIKAGVPTYCTQHLERGTVPGPRVDRTFLVSVMRFLSRFSAFEDAQKVLLQVHNVFSLLLEVSQLGGGLLTLRREVALTLRNLALLRQCKAHVIYGVAILDCLFSLLADEDVYTRVYVTGALWGLLYNNQQVAWSHHPSDDRCADRVDGVCVPVCSSERCSASMRDSHACVPWRPRCWRVRRRPVSAASVDIHSPADTSLPVPQISNASASGPRPCHQRSRSRRRCWPSNWRSSSNCCDNNESSVNVVDEKWCTRPGAPSAKATLIFSTGEPVWRPWPTTAWQPACAAAAVP